MKRILCLLALLCLFLKLPAQDTSFKSIALAPESRMVQQETAPELPSQQNGENTGNPYNRNVTLLSGKIEKASSVLYQSALLPYIEGLPTGYAVFPVSPNIGKRILATNTTLRSLFQLAYSDGGIYYSNNRTLLEVSNTAAFTSSEPKESWCYESIVPSTQASTILQVMQHDLQRFFPQYGAKVEKRKIQCLALVRLSKKEINNAAKLIASSGGEYVADFSSSRGIIRNGHLHELVERLNTDYLKDLPTPIIDETGITQKVNMILQTNMSDVAALRKSLEAYGLGLVKANHKIKVLVIRDSERYEW